MKYRAFGECGFDTSVLGLGTMRLPVLEGENDKIDEPKAIELIRHAIDNGVNYIDTAYPYHGGNSERVVGKALKGGYREKVKVVTKHPVWNVKEYADFEKYLDEQLEKLDVECIDVYLLHALNKKMWQNIDAVGCHKFLDEAKAKGKIKVAGFSIHDDFSLFKEVVDSYKWGMCMIQQNFIDVDDQVTEAGIKYAGEKGIAMAIMEPLKGGLLVNPPEEIKALFEAYDAERSSVEWALRWLAHYPEVKVILSGMSNMEQLKENLEIADRLESDCVNAEEKEIYKTAKEMYESRVQVKCTDCKYCMPCPHGVDIPENFNIFNKGYIYNRRKNSAFTYQKMMEEKERASACTGCRICEEKCPQNIKISEDLKKVDEELGKEQNFDSFHWSY